MILEEETLIEYGYLARDLPPHSYKPILATCDNCSKVRETCKPDYRALCGSCAHKGKPRTKETKAKIGAGHKGKTASEETKTNISKALKGNTNCLGYKHTDKQNARQSAAMKGEKHPNWLNGISFEPYCIKFNEEYKEHIRNLFGDECFLCARSTKENGQALSVHHVNYNKDCGCDETKCICVPLCYRCHSKTNFDRDYWQILIIQMLQPRISWGD